MEIRRAVKALAAGLIDRSGARQMIASAQRVAAGGRRVVVLGYHRVCTDFETESQRSIESCLISRATFALHVDFLSRHFELATMTRAVDVLTGRATARRDIAAITFDDGYQEVVQNALPVLQDARAPATIYLSSGVVGDAGFFPHDRLFSLLQYWTSSPRLRVHASPFVLDAIQEASAGQSGVRQWIHRLIRRRSPADLERLCAELSNLADLPVGPPSTARAIDWEGVRALAAGGFEVGAHTTLHWVLTHLDAESVEMDLRISRESIEQATGQRVQHFAYCNGYYNQTVIAALRRTGYMSGATTEDRSNRLGDDPFRIARRVMWEKSAAGPVGTTSPSLLACQLDGAWGALGFDGSESGERSEPMPVREWPPSARRSA